MATIKEIWTSRRRTIVGPGFGVVNVTREFHVTVDEHGDEPEVTIQDPRGGIAPGTPHPKFPAVFAIGYERGERLATLTYEVTVLYGDPVSFPIETDYWDFQIIGDYQEEESFYDLDGKPIGHPEFRRWEEDAPLTGNAQGLRRFKTRTKDGPIDLLLPNPLPRDHVWYARPIRLPSQTGLLIFRRLAANAPNPPSKAFGLRGTANRDPLRVRVPQGTWTFGLARRFMLESVVVTSRAGTVLGQQRPGIIYEFEVVFRYRRRPWTPYKQNILYVAPSGGESQVLSYATGEPIEEEYRVAEVSDHSALMEDLLRPGGAINIGPFAGGFGVNP